MGSSESIVHSESVGQKALASSDTLPTRVDPIGKTALESAGVVFEGVVPGDGIFQFCKLPEGWRKVPTENSYWTDLVDDLGRVRASIFYKAAFYDRDAHMNVRTRFSTRSSYPKNGLPETEAVSMAMDGTKILETFKVPVDATESWVAGEKASDLARAWLTEHHPDWKNPAAYWDL